jgi:hypothetical protein
MTAVVLLIANSMHRPNHRELFLDTHLVENSLRAFNKVLKDTENEVLHSFLATCTELHQRTQRRCAEAAIMDNSVDRPCIFR